MSAPPDHSKEGAASTLSKFKSPNCKAGEAPTSLFTFFAQTENKQDEYQSVMMSCQKNNFTTPDRATLDTMKVVSSTAMSRAHGSVVHKEDVQIESAGLPIGKQGTDALATEISMKRMASNCKPHYNVSAVTAYNKFECRYLGVGKDEDGKSVRSPFQTWKGTLPSCDNTLKISEDVENDVRHLAWHAAGGEEAGLNVDEFLCSIQTLPMQ
tara:strand:+ start:985 stop:1617 length:633 start_codon:yes stop_codon:yes gene_type:complete